MTLRGLPFLVSALVVLCTNTAVAGAPDRKSDTVYLLAASPPAQALTACKDGGGSGGGGSGSSGSSSGSSSSGSGSSGGSSGSSGSGSSGSGSSGSGSSGGGGDGPGSSAGRSEERR